LVDALLEPFETIIACRHWGAPFGIGTGIRLMSEFGGGQ
jgi:hypothetical protein